MRRLSALYQSVIYRIQSFPLWLSFLIVATVLQTFSLMEYRSALMYRHGAQRFFHVAHLANSVLGHPDTLPISFLTLAGGSSMRHDLDYINAACPTFSEADFQRLCKRDTAASPKTFGELLAIKLEPEKTFPFVSRPEAAHYSPVGYLPFVVPLVVGLWLQLPPEILLHGCIIVNAMLSIALGALVLRILPFMHAPIYFLLLLPSSFNIRKLVMPDALMMNLAFLLLALTLRYRAHPIVLSLGRKLFLVALAIVASVTKVAFFLTPLVYALIPSRCFGSGRNKIMWVTGSVIGGIIVAMAWNIYAAQQFYADFASADVGFVLTHPLESIRLIYSPFWSADVFFDRICNDMLSWNWNWMHDPWLAGVFILPLPLLALVRPAGQASVLFTGWERLFLLGVFMLTWAVIMITMLGHLGAGVNEGALRLNGVIQGRYMVPVLPYLLAAMYSVITPHKMVLAHLNNLLYIYAFISLIILNYYNLN